MRRITTFVSTLLLSLGLALPVMAQGLTPIQMNSFENFLNAHPNTAAELQHNPNLINDPNWMSHHTGLEEYMSAHPNVRAEVRQNPGAFVNNGGSWRWHNGGYGGSANNTAVERFDTGYLNEHPEVAHQLAANPGLADNPEYLSAHPGLNSYLQAHPTVRQDLISHPDRFMSKEDQLNGHPGGPYGYGGAANNSAVERFDTGYLNEHPEVAHQLAANPGLADNAQYLSAHPGLNTYLQAHPTVRQDLISHPDRFMSKEDQLNAHPGNPYVAEGYHGGPPPGTEYPEGHPAGYGNPGFVAEHPHAAAEHPQAAQYYAKHHHQQQQ